MRLDIYLHDKADLCMSRKGIQDIIKEGRVLVNEKMAKCHYSIRENDVILVEVPEVKEIDIEPESIPLEIIFEDSYLLVVNKPPGMLVHPAGGVYSGTLVNGLLAHAKGLSSIGGKFKPGIVHRLDKDTSGLLLVAKSDPVHLGLAQQFKEHTVYRKYIVLVKGIVNLDEGEIDVPVGRHPRDRTRMAVNLASGRQAKTVYRVLKRYDKFTPLENPSVKGEVDSSEHKGLRGKIEQGLKFPENFLTCPVRKTFSNGAGFTLLEVYPKTGRTHQIRVHMAYLGYPVLGDAVYGTKDKLITRQALHALEIGFQHPVTKENLKLSSSLPSDIERLIPDYKL